MAGALLFAAAAFGQQVKSREAGFDEYKALLKQSGYEAFSFDLRDFLSDRYGIVVRIKEYVGGQDSGQDVAFHFRSNKTMVEDFPEEQRAEIREEEMVDPATGTYSWAETLTVGFYPSGVDSLASLVIDIPNRGTSRSVLELRGLPVPGVEGRILYRYNTRPFQLDGAFESGKFIPLVFYGSMWYDEKSGLFRFCGEREIAPDLSSDIVGHVPHFFVIGLELTREQK